MIVIIDNYDSFTYNLYQYIGEIHPEVEVYRNDKITIEKLRRISASHIIISPGPGHPKDSGICIELIKQMHKEIPILGVCLGHQAIGQAFGGKVIHAKELVHGKASEIKVVKNTLFDGIPQSFKAGRYHSLIIDKDTLPEELEIIATTEDGQIMGVKHKDYHVYGIQFHPESILTEHGMKMLRNFLSINNLFGRGSKC